MKKQLRQPLYHVWSYHLWAHVPQWQVVREFAVAAAHWDLREMSLHFLPQVSHRLAIFVVPRLSAIIVKGAPDWRTCADVVELLRVSAHPRGATSNIHILNVDLTRFLHLRPCRFEPPVDELDRWALRSLYCRHTDISVLGQKLVPQVRRSKICHNASQPGGGREVKFEFLLRPGHSIVDGRAFFQLR